MQVTVAVESRSTKKLVCLAMFTVEFLQKAKASSKSPLDTDIMAQKFAMQHVDQPVQLNQRVRHY